MRTIGMLLLAFLSLNANGLSLREAIKYAIENQEDSLADEAAVRAAYKQVQAAWHSNYGPTGTIAYNVNHQSATAPYQNQTGNYTNWRVGISQPLWNGGVSKFNVEAQKHSSDATIWGAKSNQTDLAMAAVEAYITMIRTKQQLKFLTVIQDIYSDLYKLCSNQEDQNQISNKIAELKGDRISLTNAIRIARELFILNVGMEPDESLQDITAITEEFVPPKDAAAAFEIAQQRNPNLRATESNVLAQQNRAMAADAKNKSFEVSVYFGRSGGTSSVGIPAVNGWEAGLQVGKSINWGEIPSASAQFDKTQELELRRKGQIQNIKTQLTLAYIELEGLDEQEELKQEAYAKTLQTYNEYVALVTAGQPLSVEKAKSMINDFRSSYLDHNGLLPSQMNLAMAQIRVLAQVGNLLTFQFEPMGGRRSVNILSRKKLYHER